MRITKLIKKELAPLLIVALCASIAVPALAGAQQLTPSQHEYESTDAQINQGAEPPSSTDAAATDAAEATPSTSGLSGRVGPLPFTGFDVIAMLAVALAVAGAGLALQRAVSRDPSDGVS